MSSKVRFAVVGAGHMGSNHIKKIFAIGDRIGARVSVIVEPDELRATAIAREFPENIRPKIVANVGLLSSLGKEDYPEACIIAVPASIHVETAAACLTKGFHCLVEKPLGYSAIDVTELDRLASKSKKVLQVGLLERWALLNLWKDWQPKRGPWTINCVRTGPFVPRAADTSVIHDLMIHDIDMFVLLDTVFEFSKVKTVRAWGRKLRSSLLDYAIAAIDFEDGGMVRFFSSRLSAESHRSWEMTGPDWHASIDFLRRSLKRFERAGRDMNSFAAFETQWPNGDPLGQEIETFVRRIRGASDDELLGGVKSNWRADQLVPSAQNVLRSHEIIDEILSCIKVLE